MANDDVLKKADRHVNKIRNGWGYHPQDAEKLFIEVVDALREARELNDSRLDDVSTLLGAFNDGLFVRSTHGDSDPRWAIKLFAPLAAMARLQRSVDAAMKPPGGESGHD